MCDILIQLLKQWHAKCDAILCDSPHYLQEEILAQADVCSVPVTSTFPSKRNASVKWRSLTGDDLMLSWTPEDA